MFNKEKIKKYASLYNYGIKKDLFNSIVFNNPYYIHRGIIKDIIHIFKIINKEYIKEIYKYKKFLYQYTKEFICNKLYNRLKK